MKHLTRDKTIRFRCSDVEYAKLEAYALSKGQTSSQVLREYLRRLPSLNKSEIN